VVGGGVNSAGDDECPFGARIAALLTMAQIRRRGSPRGNKPQPAAISTRARRPLASSLQHQRTLRTDRLILVVLRKRSSNALLRD